MPPLNILNIRVTFHIPSHTVHNVDKMAPTIGKLTSMKLCITHMKIKATRIMYHTYYTPQNCIGDTSIIDTSQCFSVVCKSRHVFNMNLSAQCQKSVNTSDPFQS